MCDCTLQNLMHCDPVSVAFACLFFTITMGIIIFGICGLIHSFTCTSTDEPDEELQEGQP